MQFTIYLLISNTKLIIMKKLNLLISALSILMFGACIHEEIPVKIPDNSPTSIEEKYEILNQFMDVQDGQWIINLSEEEASNMGILNEYQNRFQCLAKINISLKDKSRNTNDKILFILNEKYIVYKNGKLSSEEPRIKTKGVEWIPANARFIAETQDTGSKQYILGEGPKPKTLYLRVYVKNYFNPWTCSGWANYSQGSLTISGYTGYQFDAPYSVACSNSAGSNWIFYSDAPSGCYNGEFKFQFWGTY